jgi:peptidoglycan-binding protein ArfA
MREGRREHQTARPGLADRPGGHSASDGRNRPRSVGATPVRSRVVGTFDQRWCAEDFAVTVRGDTITLAGTAASPDQKNTIATDAKRIWSNLNVVDNLAVNAPTASPSPTAAGSCTDLQSAINTLTDGALTFESNVGSLTASDEQVLARVADKLNTCPDAHAAINGYADNIGNASLNVPLSEERTQTVAG